MELLWTPQGWEDYLHWQATDKAKVKKINALIKDALKTPYAGLGKPEQLRFDLSGHWSRRIDLEHRLVYAVENGCLKIIACRYHYA
ncbi:MAG TPA: Txe/YoeB family addiction module toxin [Solidesulfovibrio magneticus]|nr:Txe/YoeB family addiction module toxin [Solidesulfovibrio magneticus]